MANFGILDVAKKAAMAPFLNIFGLLASVGVMVVFYVSAGFIFVGTVDFTDIQAAGTDQIALAEALIDVFAASWHILLVLILFSLVMGAGLFNYWVRTAALGKGAGGFASVGDLLSAAFINGIKLLGAGLVIGVAVMILSFVLVIIFGLVGLVSVDADSVADPTSVDAGTIGLNVLIGVGISFVYAIISSSLTKTALGADHREVADHRVQDFATVLILIYVPVILISALLPAIIGLAAGITVSMLISLWSTFAIAAAHGYRHQRCLEMEATATEL